MPTRLLQGGLSESAEQAGGWGLPRPILFAGGQGNLYVYVGNDPVGFVDPEGNLSVLVGAGVGAAAGALAAGLRGGDLQAIIAGAIGGGIAGGIAGASLGLGVGGWLGQQGFAAGLGGLVGDFANLRKGANPASLSDVAEAFAVRAGFGIAGGVFVQKFVVPLSAPGFAGTVSQIGSELVVGTACGMESDFVTE